MEIIDSYLETLHEAGNKQRSKVTVSRQTKIKRSQGQLSTSMAKSKNDPQYKLLKKHCDLCKKYREIIHKKYGARNLSKARK
jgi:hypothetical protein